MEMLRLPFGDKEPPKPKIEITPTTTLHVGIDGYEDRTSDAARDQGWGPLDIRVRPETTPRKKPLKRSARFPLHSSVLTRRELDPDLHHVPADLADKDTVNAALAEARQMLDQLDNPRQPYRHIVRGANIDPLAPMLPYNIVAAMQREEGIDDPSLAFDPSANIPIGKRGRIGR